MANSTLSDDISTSFTSIFQRFHENLLHPIGFIQIGAIAVGFLIAWLFATEIRKFLEEDIDRVRAHMHVVVSPAHFAIIFKIFILLWIAAIAVTRGAIGFAVGIGLQKIGSNLVSGIMLLYRKPIRQGDVIAFERSFAGVRWGWITDIGLMYVKVATRTGSLLLIPDELFLTQQIENLSFDDDRTRLNIPFGIAYESDLNKAKTLALSAAGSIERVLKIPEPKCLVLDYGDSTVNMELRVWIEDPKNGIRNFEDAVLMAVWDNFHANGITIAFPQRDLHIKSAVPLKISGP